MANKLGGITIEQVRSVIKEEIKPFVEKVEIHDKYLIRGNGQPSLLEDMRTVKGYQSEQKAWLKAIALMFIGQFVVITVGFIYTLIQILPYLKQLVDNSLK